MSEPRVRGCERWDCCDQAYPDARRACVAASVHIRVRPCGRAHTDVRGGSTISPSLLPSLPLSHARTHARAHAQPGTPSSRPTSTTPTAPCRQSGPTRHPSHSSRPLTRARNARLANRSPPRMMAAAPSARGLVGDAATSAAAGRRRLLPHLHRPGGLDLLPSQRRRPARPLPRRQAGPGRTNELGTARVCRVEFGDK